MIRILLVEDDPAYARLVKERLRGDPDLVLAATAATLAEAIDMAREHTPDVVMLDLGLPDSEGASTVGAFHAAHTRVPVVVLSNQSDVEVALEAMRDGAQEFLVKGLADDKLMPRVLRSAIERKRLQEVEQLLVGVIGHDLRGPLQTISFSIEAAALDASTKGKARLERAMAACRRATGLVNDLLDATQARVGGMLAIAVERVDLSALVRQLAGELVKETHRLRLDITDGITANVDTRRISQVVMNLLGNAIQHGDGNPIDLWLRRRDDVIELGVHNTGTPIVDELRDKLFEPLERARMANPTHSVGLGLYIVQQLVIAHGGTIAFESTAASGTTFRVHLPAR